MWEDLPMKKILKLVRKFIDGIDVSDDIKDGFSIAIDFNEKNNIGSLVVYDREVSDIDMGVSRVNEQCKDLKCKVFEIILLDGKYELWFVSAVLEMKLTYERLELMRTIIKEMYRYK